MKDHDWIVEVIDDLSRYAEKNEFPKLSEHLLDARAVARREISIVSVLRSDAAAKTIDPYAQPAVVVKVLTCPPRLPRS